ncbi:alpha/beta fold hydrolase [Gynuella sunshinyii]|uniref:Proline iminopeptidase n=1 Tax=Gynuella sunshinyii YC6258 TaxID=1445510 RepID=A0A0C5VS72_9GAMM|nr:alpha/beta fold hydrolase [Gynuella sunshinyii]AJQ97071.1 putative hydrolase or acyltransferase (alpha/beta hydrolase superfamily) [Gynuella sunshinyii YC6258]
MTLLNGCSTMTLNKQCRERADDALCYEQLRATDDGISRYEGMLSRNIKSRDGKILLPYKRYSSGADRPLVFFLGGGPGITNLSYQPPASLLQHYDVVMLEYRGVGKSSVKLESPYFRKAMTRLKGSLSLEAVEKMRPLYRRGFEDLKARGFVFDDFAIEEIVADLELLRTRLGYQTVNLVAHSFGTRVALKYKYLHPQVIDASVLFALNTPGGFIWYPQQTQAVLQRYQQSIASVGSADSQAFEAMLQQPKPWPKRWLGIPTDPAKTLFTSFMMSYNRHTAGYAYKALLDAQDGGSFHWFLLARTYGIFIRVGFNWPDLFLKAYLEDCNPEWVEEADRQGRDAVFQSPSSILFGGYREFLDVYGECRPRPIILDFSRTLVVAGEFDISTPLERLPPSLPSEQLIIVKNFGHADPLYREKERAGQVISRYLTDQTFSPDAFGHPSVFVPKAFVQ